MGLNDRFGFIDILMGNRRAKVFFDKGLQAKKYHIVVTFARFDIA